MSFKALVHTGEDLSEGFTQIVAIVDGVAWELDSTLSGINKDAAGYRLKNAANLTGGPNYIKGELETAVGRAKEVMDACKPLQELALRWAAEEAALDAKPTGDPGKAARFEIRA